MEWIKYHEAEKVFDLRTENSTYQMQVREYDTLVHLYYGCPVGDSLITDRIVCVDRGFSGNPYEAGKDKTFSLDTLPQEYTAYGNGDYRINGLEVEQAYMTLMTFINDALMAVFFFSVGLEIKREILVGELSSFRQALLPIVAACGGMLVPVLIYYFMTAGTPAQSGLAIPMATDIAFSLGVLSLFGKRVPLSLKVFLTAFAVVDDIGGILVIALFYTSHLSVNYLIASAGILLILCGGNFFRVRNRWFYIFWGVIMWYLFLQSGIHATIAGVVAAFTVPATPHYKIGKYINRIRENIAVFPASDKESVVLSKMQINVLKSIESSSDRVISPLQSLEDSLHGMVNYIILPLFAFANAGVSLTADHGGLEVGMATWAVLAGLLAGKFAGIYFFTWLVIKMGFAGLLKGMTWVNLTGICLLGGIGFTVSLFIANLSFGDSPVLLTQAKMGVILGTVLAGVLAYLVLQFALPKQPAQE